MKTGKKQKCSPGKNEDGYSALFYNNYSVSLLIDPDTGGIVDANDAAVRYYGYTRDQLLSMKISDLNRLGEDKVIRDLKRARNEGQKHFISKHFLAGGEMRNVEIYSGPITVNEKPFFYSIIHDITDRKKAEAELKKNQYLLSEAMDMAHMAHWEFDVPTGIFTFNDRFYTLYGTTAEREGDYQMPAEVYAREFVHPDEAELVAEEVGHAITTTDPDYHALIEHRIIRRDGEIRHIVVRIRITKDAEGRTIKTHGANQDITDRKQTEQSLRESEERYNALFSNSYSVSLLIDPDTGRIVDANDAAARYYGYGRDYLVSLKISDLNHLPEEKVIRNLKRAKTEGQKHFFSTHYRANGEMRYVEVYSGPITVQGKPLFYSIIHDITDRKKAEQALQDSETKLNVILQSSPIPKFVIDMHHHIISWNKALEESSGIRARDVIGTDQHWRGFYREARPCLADLIVDGDVGKIPLLYEGKYKKSAVVDGAYEATDFFPHLGEKGKWLHFIAAPIRDAGKSIIGAVETLEDITGIVVAEQSLRESEERYRTLIDQIPDYVLVHRNGIILYVNPPAAAQLGYVHDSPVGKPITSFITPEYHETVKKAMAIRMAGGEMKPYEITIVARDGTLHSVLVNGAKIQYMGEPASLNVLTDITPIKAAEEAIRRANEALEKRVAERTEALTRTNVQMVAEITARKSAELEISKSLEEKELLLREIHHRVKNNLQIIISLLNLQSRHIHDPNILDAIHDSQNRVRAMALVHERIYRSHNIATINLKDYIRFLVNQIFSFYSVQHSRIGLNIDMEEYPADIDIAIPIGLIMNELVSNSIKHAFSHNRNGEISIACTQPEPDILQFVYRDTGSGFTEGFDWRNTESLGLRLVNSLVEQLDGTIEKGTGNGTTFIITLHRKTKGGSTA